MDLNQSLALICTVYFITWCLIWLLIFASSTECKWWLSGEVTFFRLILIWCWCIASDLLFRSWAKCKGFLADYIICYWIRARTRCRWKTFKLIPIAQRVDWLFRCYPYKKEIKLIIGKIWTIDMAMTCSSRNKHKHIMKKKHSFSSSKKMTKQCDYLQRKT